VDSEVREKVNSLLDQVNDLLTSNGVTPFKLKLVAPAELTPAPKNARFMTKEVFDVLVAGVKKQGFSSLPFCYFDGKDYWVLSGNHRVKAAVAAKVPLVLIIYTDKAMSRQEQVALQLAHNQVTGQDNPQILKELWQEIQDLDWKYLTGFDDDFFEQLEPVEFSPIKDSPIKVKFVSIVFIQEDLDRIEEAVEAIEEASSKDSNLLARFEDFKIFFEAVLQAKEDLGIVNTATAVRKMAEITLEKLSEERAKNEPNATG